MLPLAVVIVVLPVVGKRPKCHLATSCLCLGFLEGSARGKSRLYLFWRWCYSLLLRSHALPVHGGWPVRFLSSPFHRPGILSQHGICLVECSCSSCVHEGARGGGRLVAGD